MRRWKTVLTPALLGTGWLLCLFAPLLSPGLAMANRDISSFHLPLRSAFRDLAKHGLPLWNPWLHGGQPVLSNPSYGAFYPPSWLVFAVSPSYALNLMVVLHGMIAFAGAWRLARHFGCGRPVAALAAVGYTGCASFLSLLSAYTLFGSMAWFPWVAAWADESLRIPRGEPWWRPALLAGGALGLQLLNGEPSTVVISGLALLALAASAAGRRPASAPRVLVPVAFAVALSAVQLLPTLGRIADSPRKDIPARTATTWSMPPERLVEAVFPRFFGDPARVERGLFMGWKLNDRDYPYVESLYPGLLLAVLGLAALIRGPIPRRAAWVLAILGGILLALGRYNPLYEVLRRTVPVLAVLRFPEKFILLSVFTLGFAGVLGWQRLLDDRDAGRRDSADLPLALAVVVLATALTFCLLFVFEPRIAAWLVYSHGRPDTSQQARSLALSYLFFESAVAVVNAAAVTGLLLLCRWRRPSRRLLERLALLLLAADLWYYGHGFLRVMPASVYRDVPPLARAMAPIRDRIFPEDPLAGASDLMARGGDPRSRGARTQVAILSPYAGLLWNIPYAFDLDFEMLLTGWGRKAQNLLVAELGQPPMAYSYLGAWNVGTVLRPLTRREQLAAEKDSSTLPRKIVKNALVLPRFRFVPRVTFHPSHEAAVAAARASKWRVGRREQCVRPGRPPASLAYTRPPRLLGVVDEAARAVVRYRSRDGAFLVVASTFDRGWRARVDGRPVPAYPTAACQIGVELPAGEHRLVLEYRDPLVGLGAGVTLASLAFGAAALAWTGRRRSLVVEQSPRTIA
ncbi:MAG TPA: hypothetical protein VHC97_07095 [Thermoanaerobaculia bacterium]|jgi:hypothetical protein|nr:hypothetical protein [Thermoanaerobaculia bacterium]